MTQYGFFFDEGRCTDCRACSVACKDWNDLAEGERWLNVYSQEKGAFPSLSGCTTWSTCFHCEEPACINACPNGAIVKEGRFGAVLVDDARCVGCGVCASACPHGAPVALSGVATKCTMCVDRLANDLVPACASACPTRALDFGPMNTLVEKYGDLREPANMSTVSTKPAFLRKDNAAHREVVEYDAERARELFGMRASAYDHSVVSNQWSDEF